MLNSKRSRYVSCVKVAHNALSVYLYGPLTLLVNIYKRRSDVVTADSLTIYTSYYKRMGSASLLKLCDRVLELGYQNLDVLADYNITSSTLEQLFTRQQALLKACESLLLYEQKRKEAAMTVAVLTQQAQQYLNLSDLFMEMISFNEPTLFRSYRQLRKGAKQRSKAQLWVRVADAATKTRSSNATITIEMIPQPGDGNAKQKQQKFVRTTGKTGRVYFRLIPYGIYRVTIAKVGCQTVTLTAVVADSKPVKLAVELVVLDYVEAS